MDTNDIQNFPTLPKAQEAAAQLGHSHFAIAHPNIPRGAPYREWRWAVQKLPTVLEFIKDATPSKYLRTDGSVR